MSSPLRVLVRRLPARTPTGLLRSCPRAAAFSTARPVCLARAPLRQTCSPLSMPKTFPRANRNFASSAQNASDVNTAKTTAAGAESPTLDWNSFFKLRLRRRRIQLAFSVTTGFIGLFGGAGLLSTGVAEPVVSQIPMDPFFTLAIMTMASGAFGWLIGPSIGGQIFYLVNRGLAPQIRQKESQFLTRVKLHRADPSNSSAGRNPVPDYYGEKIHSVEGYRRWLKDQRAFNKKKNAAFV